MQHLPLKVNIEVGIVYFKRYRMEVDLARPLFPQPELAAEYRLAAWDDRLLEAHAETKFHCFRWELAGHP